MPRRDRSVARRLRQRRWRTGAGKPPSRRIFNISVSRSLSAAASAGVALHQQRTHRGDPGSATRGESRRSDGAIGRMVVTLATSARSNAVSSTSARTTDPRSISVRVALVVRDHHSRVVVSRLQQITGSMGDERAAIVCGRTDRELWTRGSNVDETQQMRRAAMRRNTTGRQRRGLKLGHRRSAVPRRREIRLDAARASRPLRTCPAIYTVGEPDCRRVVCE